jgi:dihydrofolate reductase
MSELRIDLFSSLDGFGAAAGWPGYWGLEGPELFAWLEEELARDQIAVMGADTYRLLSAIVAEQEDPTFARMAELPKVVFSSTLRPPLSWANTRVVAEDAVPAIRAMKREGTTPIRTMGSLSMGRSLLAAGLVDRFRVVVFPVITGVTGRQPIFRGMPDLDLEMVDSRTLDGRLQVLEYIPTLH